MLRQPRDDGEAVIKFGRHNLGCLAEVRREHAINRTRRGFGCFYLVPRSWLRLLLRLVRPYDDLFGGVTGRAGPRAGSDFARAVGL